MISKESTLIELDGRTHFASSPSFQISIHIIHLTKKWLKDDLVIESACLKTTPFIETTNARANHREEHCERIYEQQNETKTKI